MIIAHRYLIAVALTAVVATACSSTQQTRKTADEPATAAGAASMAVYRDRDPAAVGYHAQPGQENKLRHSIERTLQKDPQNVAALTQRAYWHAQDGEPELAQRDYEAAMAASEGHGPNRRRVLWSRGWTHYNQGDIAAALSDWNEAVRLHGGRPFWVPYTFAVAYWTQGDRQRALIWYGTAVASNASWGDEGSMKRRTRHWKDGEKQQLHALFAAWRGSRELASAAAH